MIWIALQHTAIQCIEFWSLDQYLYIKKIDVASVFAFSFLSIISCQSQDVYVLLQINDSIVTKTTITVPVNGGPVEAVSTIKTVPGYWIRSRTGEMKLASLDTSLFSSARGMFKWAQRSEAC